MCSIISPLLWVVKVQKSHWYSHHLVPIPMMSLHVLYQFTFPLGGEGAEITLEFLALLSGCRMKLALVTLGGEDLE